MKPIGLYIHVPFCKRKCCYCDFYSLTGRESCIDSWCDAVIRNIRRYNQRYDTVYFGGGTPSLLDGRHINDILSATDITENAEITAECNPDSASLSRLKDFYSAGVNRISVGVQSLCDSDLKMLTRLHNADNAVQTIRNAQAVGFDNISADLMLGTPCQTADNIIKSINILASLDITHVSAYMLKIEEGTPLGNDIALGSQCADDESLAELYELTADRLISKGFDIYEISNFAKKGFECRHNLKYWRCEDYIGIGPSAHSCFNGKRFAADADLDSFISADTQNIYITDNEPCTLEEKIMLGLRLTEGFDISQAGELASVIIKKAAHLEKAGLLTVSDSIIALTLKGFLVSNSVICMLTDF